MEDKALNVVVPPSAGIHDVGTAEATMTTESIPYDMPGQATAPSNTSSSFFSSSSSSSSQDPHYFHQDFSTARNIRQGLPQTPQSDEDFVHRQSLWDPSITSAMSSSLEGSSSLMTLQVDSTSITRRRFRSRDEFSVYMCLDAIILDTSSSSTRARASAQAAAAAGVDASSSSSLRRDHHHVHDDDSMEEATIHTTAAAFTTNPNVDNDAIGRYDFETIVVLYNMALTLHCLGQLTLSCFIYDLADRVLRGQSMERIRNDPILCRLALAISNNLGQILWKLGYWDVARTYVYRLADYLLSMDPPATSEQAKERLEYILNIYWFDHPPSASAA
jgi:hypothetical protein